ncbi:MAG: NUDIX domain-containing protein [Solirubrobacteraceae bacterium]|jgi:8-oxo-dGTP pyrophosphatase MutT (NUDIX family)
MLTLRRLGYRFAYRGLQLLWFLTRPDKHGVKCLVCDRRRVLLVRHTYGPRAWDIPGGSMKRNESPLSAAQREMSEELGLDGADWTPIGAVNGNVAHRRDTIHCFTVELSEPALRIDRVELASVEWFDREALPDDLGPYVAPILARAPARPT